ncbi:MAG: hypothetical protein JW837_16380 [Sedimentisphaerales bacterium]|nr:hypothetical protein [Sedimentisphaerales bacterium]
MATKAQIQANRRNSKKSTGPRTQKGRAIVSKNAISHGLSARQTVIGSEKQADFDLYRDIMLAELMPDSPMQASLAERIISLSWRLKRIANIQNQTIDALNKDNTSSPLDELTRSILSRYFPRSQDSPHHSAYLPQSPHTTPHHAPHLLADTPVSDPDLALGRMAIKDFSNARVLDRLLMYERRLEHSLYKTILEFQRLQLIKKINLDSEVKIRELECLTK